LDWAAIFAGPYRDWLLSGLKVTLALSGVSIVFALSLGLVLAAARLSPLWAVRALAGVYIEFVRNTPLLVQIFFWYFGAYAILPAAVNDWLNRGNFEFAAAVIALALYTGAFIAEDIRSGIRAVPRGQLEAARSSGFSYAGAMCHVILPQALRLTVPPLVNQFLNLIKNSSLAMTIGVAELTYQARQIESASFKSFEAFASATLIYLALSLAINAVVALYRRRVALP
jgi:polar amino acid transport system permease protein